DRRSTAGCPSGNTTRSRRRAGAPPPPAASARRGPPLAAHELAEQRDVIALLERRVELVRDAEDGIVDHDLDVLAELRVVGTPECRVEVGEAGGPAPEDVAYCLAGGEGLGEELAARAVTADVPGHPRRDLDGHGKAWARAY